MSRSTQPATAAPSSSSSSSSDHGPFVRALLPRPPSALVKSRPRLVLLQHTLRLPVRLVASSPAAGAEPSGSRRRKVVGTGPPPSVVKEQPQPRAPPGGSSASTEDEVYRLAGLRTPSECAERDAAGGLFVLAALETLVGRTGGRVVWVRVADNLALPEPEEEGGGWVRTFRKFGAVVDLASDAMGWDADGGETDADAGDNCREGAPVYSSRMDNLESVASAVERAAVAAASSGLDLDHASREDGPDLIDEETTCSGYGCTKTDSRMAVPIVFDSVNPLFTMHGIGPIMKLLRRLAGRTTARESIKDLSPRQCLSPIVTPILMEAVRPASLRRLEDEADGVLTLSGGEMRTVRRGGGVGGKGGAAGRLVNDIQPFSIEFSAGGRAGGMTKLVLCSKGGQDPGGPNGGGTRPEASTAATVGVDTVEPPTHSALVAKPSLHQTKPTLRHEEGRREGPGTYSAMPPPPPSSSTQQKSGAPRIYVQDDDPEFDDLDEEDLDDDLDL